MNYWLMKTNRHHIDFDDVPTLDRLVRELYVHLYVSLVNLENEYGEMHKIEAGLDITNLLAYATPAPCPPVVKCGLKIALPRWSDITWYNPKLQRNMIRLHHDKSRTYVTTSNLWKAK